MNVTKHNWSGFSRDTIKYFAMFTMLLNHIAHVFLSKGTLLYEVMEDIGYFTAITMCYFLVEGYQYTRSKRKYGQRLLIFAFLSQIPYSLAFSKEKLLECHNLNMLVTLFLCFLILVVEEQVKNLNKKMFFIFLLMMTSGICDWPFMAPMFTIFFIRARQEEQKLLRYYLISAFAFLICSLAEKQMFYPPAESVLFALLSTVGILLSGFVVIYCYNGKRAEKGKTFSKWFCYLFYPMHLLILGILRLVLKG